MGKAWHMSGRVVALRPYWIPFGAISIANTQDNSATYGEIPQATNREFYFNGKGNCGRENSEFEVQIRNLAQKTTKLASALGSSV